MDDISIKELEKGDFDEFSGFYETLSNLSETKDIGSDKAALILEKMNNQNSHVFIVVAGKEIIGTATILLEQKITRDQGVVGHVEDVVTRKEYQGKGIGRQLMNHLIDYAKQNGCYKIILDCKENNIGFYEKFGFKTHEIMMRLDL